MLLTTSYGDCDGVTTAAVSWGFPAGHTVPYGAINAILVAFWNLDPEVGAIGEHPYFRVVRDEDGEQIGLFLADTRVELSDEDKLILFRQIFDEESKFPQRTPWKPGNWNVHTFWRQDMGLAGMDWRMPPGQAFPEECFNAILYGLYTQDIQPILYPVFDEPTVGSGVAPQIGVLFAGGLREQFRSPEEFRNTVRSDYSELMAFNLGDDDLPWKQRMFNHD